MIGMLIELNMHSVKITLHWYVQFEVVKIWQPAIYECLIIPLIVDYLLQFSAAWSLQQFSAI